MNFGSETGDYSCSAGFSLLITAQNSSTWKVMIQRQMIQVIALEEGAVAVGWYIQRIHPPRCKEASNKVGITEAMATRTVRLDEEEEAVLRQIRDLTGLPISQILKRGVRAFQRRLSEETAQTPYEVFRSLDLGPGGYAIAPSRQTSRAVRDAIRKKPGR
jgi:hypothetical protein